MSAIIAVQCDKLGWKILFYSPLQCKKGGTKDERLSLKFSIKILFET